MTPTPTRLDPLTGWLVPDRPPATAPPPPAFRRAAYVGLEASVPLDPSTPESGFSGAPAPGPHRLLGMAVRFAAWSDPFTLTYPLDGVPEGFEVRSRTAPGALAGCLDAVARGEHAVRLLVDHQGDDALADTADGSLRLWPRRDGLLVTVHGPRAERVIDVVRAGRWKLSAGTRPLRAAVGRSADERWVLVDAAEEWLDEVSLVEGGSFGPGTWILPAP